MDLGAMLHQSADRFGDALAVVIDTPDGTDRHTFRSLDRASNRIANGLLSAGVGFGDPVALLAHNSLPFVETLCACLKIGAPVVPINVRFDASDVNDVLNDANPAALVAQPELLRDLSYNGDRLADRDLPVFVTAPDDKYRSFDELGESSADPPGVTVDESTVDGYFYTSGSTGQPKGVVHTHNDRLYANVNVIAEFGLRHDDVHCTPLPMFHSGPLYTGLVPFLQFGVPTVLLDRFNPERTLAAVDRWDATILGGVPAQYRRLVETATDGTAGESLRFWWVSGAPLTDELRERCEATFCRTHSIVYGATEVGPQISTLQPSASRDRPMSCGTGHMGQRIRIVAADGDPDPEATLPAGEAGELIVAGESVMERYLNRPDETEAAFVGDWYFTGDIGRRDGDGYLYVEGRKDDMIISGGENIHPSEIETVLETHPEIADVVVLGVAHEKWGQTPKAFVVRTPASDLDAERVMAYCRDSALASYKRPREVAFVDEIPRNPSGGSVLTAELRALDDS